MERNVHPMRSSSEPIIIALNLNRSGRT